MVRVGDTVEDTVFDEQFVVTDVGPYEVMMESVEDGEFHATSVEDMATSRWEVV